MFTSDGSGGGTVAIDNSGGTEVASFNVQLISPRNSRSAREPGDATVVSAPTAEILFQNASTGQVASWELDANLVSGGAALSANPGPNWRAVGTGDFNDDGEPDVLLTTATAMSRSGRP